MEALVKALLQSNAAQRETNELLATQQQQSSAAQRERNELLATQQQQAYAAQRETNELLAAQQQQAQASMQAQVTVLAQEAMKDRQALAEVLQRLSSQTASVLTGSPGDPLFSAKSPFLQKMTPQDDVEAFLCTFERTAEGKAWPREQWAALLAPLLIGDSQKAYFDLSSEDARDYEKIKTEILLRLGVTTSMRAQRVHDWGFHAKGSPRSQIYDLINLVRLWLQPEILTGPQIVERVAMDRFQRALPPALQKGARQADPKSKDDLAELVERYLAAEDLGTRAAGSRPPTARRNPPVASRPNPGLHPARQLRSSEKLEKGVGGAPPAERPQPGNPRGTYGPPQCWRCSDWGHIAKECPLNQEPMECDMGRRTSWFARPGLVADPEVPSAAVRINGRGVHALLDSGSLVTLVHSRLVDPEQMTQRQVGVVCIHGDCKKYPTARVDIVTHSGTVSHEVAVSPLLLHSVILGRDFPLFHDLCSGRPDLPGGTKAEYPKPREPPMTERALGMVPTEESMGFPLAACAGDPEETPETPEMPGLPELEVSRDNFGTAQLRDPTLEQARNNVSVSDGTPVAPGLEEVFPHMAVDRDMLYRVDKVRGEVVEQLVVPSPYRRTVLALAHPHPMGGHLAYEKTLERILQRFFWPGIYAEVRRYCESCPECQRSAPMPHYRSPLVPLPVIEVPFDRIAMDLVGPIVKSARGHQYILVVMDYATRYPEAIPLRNTSSKTIARELVQMFTRTGTPKEILTDQGTPFMSRVMKELCKMLNIKHLHTSVYHPQTDGLVERFNKTLKNMLKKVVDKDGRDWDCLLPYLLFAIREVPQSSTGFSPFELLYGRRPRGLLDIAKETWEAETTPYRSIIEHISAMQDRIAAVMPLVREHMQQAQEAQSRVYNRSARVRTFQPGDRVLVLVPTVESKFLAKWQGPYEILEKVGEVNYRVSQPDRRKKEQIYHVNLLKAWKDREALLAQNELPQQEENGIKGVRVPETLSGSQRQEVRGFLQCNRDFFSELPGCTNIIRHDIVTDPKARVRLKPYRIPEARRQAIAEEVQRMLDLGVIEKSRSEWCSPIVLVPKPDGSLRFCNDFRKLNEVSKFDTYPMPRVDELVERLGPARYITTLDLTRGYWQVPLTKEAREKTAFATPEGLWQYVRMPFGLNGAPATFQRMMDEILRPHQRYSAAYLDDVVIWSPDWASHLPKVQAVINAIRNAGLTANPKKCAMGLEEARYLGYTIGRGLIKPQVQKVEAIRNWPAPATKRQVRTFLGMVGYYRRFIPQFATTAAPLTDLTKGKCSSGAIKWNPEAEAAFQGLKEALCNQPVLIAPDFDREFVVQTDASGVGLGAVLSQVVGGEEHPVVYLSRKLTPAEQNYSIVERECLAIKWALEALRYYLLGRRFRLVTDHAPLKWMAQAKDRNARVTRWFLTLQDFSFIVEHRAGCNHRNADALSRTHCLIGSVRTHGFQQRGEVCDNQPLSVIDGVYLPPSILRFMR